MSEEKDASGTALDKEVVKALISQVECIDDPVAIKRVKAFVLEHEGEKESEEICSLIRTAVEKAEYNNREKKPDWEE